MVRISSITLESECTDDERALLRRVLTQNQLEKIHTNLRSANIDPSTVTFWEGTSEDFVERERRAGTTFDFVFIDGNHSHYPVMVDLQWADMVNPGGFVCMHDHRMDKFPGVVWSATHFLKKNPNYTVQEKVDSLIVLKKNAAGSGRGVTKGDLNGAMIAQHLNKLERSLKKRFKF